MLALSFSNDAEVFINITLTRGFLKLLLEVNCSLLWGRCIENLKDD